MTTTIGSARHHRHHHSRRPAERPRFALEVLDRAQVDPEHPAVASVRDSTVCYELSVVALLFTGVCALIVTAVGVWRRSDGCDCSV